MRTRLERLQHLAHARAVGLHGRKRRRGIAREIEAKLYRLAERIERACGAVAQRIELVLGEIEPPGAEPGVGDQIARDEDHEHGERCEQRETASAHDQPPRRASTASALSVRHNPISETK